MKSKEIGRKTLIRYCIISMLVFLAAPIFIDIFFQIFSDSPKSAITFFKNLTTEIIDNKVFYVVQAIFVSIAIWLLGGAAGRLIIEKEKSKSLVGALTLFLLWVILFLSSTLTAAFQNYLIWGQEGFKSVVTKWIIYGLLAYLILGAIHGLLFGYFVGRDIKNKGRV
ncbi:hypothetical protein [Pontibacter litorisediminis]|uniref:hypothetical protein n=1 Tax=Pontibacter litorisediminis TaxID=1846260 RepID=UPI0023ED8819|nr:hypothetical protein [Pontibacter litorisediminis]